VQTPPLSFCVPFSVFRIAQVGSPHTHRPKPLSLAPSVSTPTPSLPGLSQTLKGLILARPVGLISCRSAHGVSTLQSVPLLWSSTELVVRRNLHGVSPNTGPTAACSRSMRCQSPGDRPHEEGVLKRLPVLDRSPAPVVPCFEKQGRVLVRALKAFCSPRIRSRLRSISSYRQPDAPLGFLAFATFCDLGWSHR